MAGHLERYNKYLELNRSLKGNDECLDKLNDLLTCGRTRLTNRGPVEFTSYLFCGSKADAHDISLLRKLGITHVLNCAPGKHRPSFTFYPSQPSSSSSSYCSYARSSFLSDSKDTYHLSSEKDGIKDLNNFYTPGTKANPYAGLDCGAKGYLEVDALDNASFPILKGCYDKVKRFIDSAKNSGGKVFAHCELGMNRSISLCIAYVLDKVGISLLQTVRQIISDRPNILTNEGFRQQLVEFAKDRNLAS